MGTSRVLLPEAGTPEQLAHDVADLVRSAAQLVAISGSGMFARHPACRVGNNFSMEFYINFGRVLLAGGIV